ncbi:unnamed protein product [Ectocarpus sp. 8 AP-2014]
MRRRSDAATQFSAALSVLLVATRSMAGSISRRLTRFFACPPSLPPPLCPKQPYATCKMNEFCMTRTTAELEALPVLTIHMDGGVEVNMRPEAYMEASSDDENAYAPRIYLTESMGGVLGANLLRDHNVVFDYDNHVVGFADGACDYHADSRGSDGGSAGAEGGPAVEAEANVDCVTAVKRVEECDAECPTGQSEPSTAEGREIWVDEIITHPQGSGHACPEKMAEERRGCVKDCP